jgi:hypothetical protein
MVESLGVSWVIDQRAKAGGPIPGNTMLQN